MARTKKPDPKGSADPKAKTAQSKTAQAKTTQAKTTQAKPARNTPAKASASKAGDTLTLSQTDKITPVEKDRKPESPIKPEKAPQTAETSTQSAAVPDGSAKRGGFASAFIGGILAVTIGFIAARSEVLDSVLPGSLKSNDMSGAIAALQQADTKQAGQLREARAEIAALDIPDIQPLNAQLTAVQTDITTLKTNSEAQQAQLQALEAQLIPLDTRLSDLEKRPMTDGASEVAIAAYDRELAALRDAVTAQRVEVETMIDEARATEATARDLQVNAEAAARDAENQATAIRLRAALDNGSPFDTILAELKAAGIPVSDDLGASAAGGVATLASLSDAFPSAARAALSAARAQTQGGSGIGGFLQRQLGARSVEPRDGDDPDAILSRAEAAVTAGKLSKALEEIADLPETARAAMQGWAEGATTRLNALQAVEELHQRLNTN